MPPLSLACSRVGLIWAMCAEESQKAFAGRAFAPDGSLVVGDQMRNVRIWWTGLGQNYR